jgi:hypothetical protein
MDCTTAHYKDCTGLSLHAQVVAVGMHSVDHKSLCVSQKPTVQLL